MHCQQNIERIHQKTESNSVPSTHDNSERKIWKQNKKWKMPALKSCVSFWAFREEKFNKRENATQFSIYNQVDFFTEMY